MMYTVLASGGSPPHTRGKLSSIVVQRPLDGITPAYAGKIYHPMHWAELFWDHPRIRGENTLCCRKIWRQSGSPPHTRGKSVFLLFFYAHSRITPAYAGKMRPQSAWLLAYWDHPRIRGENKACGYPRAARAGSPPHTRGKCSTLAPGLGGRGITPAYAGKMHTAKRVAQAQEDHPRIRGENL